MAAAASFSDLPTEALDEIARRVGPLDNVSCSAICRPWRRALKTTRLRLLKHPSRLHSVYLDYWSFDCDPSWYRISEEEKKSWTKVCLGESGCYGHSGIPDAVLAHEDGLPRPTRVIGCSFGWVVIVDIACGLALLDPFTGRRFALPPVVPSRGRKVPNDHDLMCQGKHIEKAALVPCRRLGAYAVMLIHNGGHSLSFLAPGAKSWTTLRPLGWRPKKYLDIIFHNGAFYTVSLDYELNAWVPDGGSTGLRARRVVYPEQERAWAVLVETVTRDDLLMVSTTDKRATLRKEHPYEVSRYDDVTARNY